MTYQCPRCKERGQTWEGSPPRCGFDEQGNFVEDNWNCATLNALREMAKENKVSCDNDNMSIIAAWDVGFAILHWYKDRGTTEDFRNEYFKPGTLHLAQLLLGDVEPVVGFN